jgi:hypothetical protein
LTLGSAGVAIRVVGTPSVLVVVALRNDTLRVATVCDAWQTLCGFDVR